MENLKGYKSVIFFVLALLVVVADMFGFAGFEMSADQAELFGVIVPVIGLLLRYVSNTAIFQKSAG